MNRAERRKTGHKLFPDDKGAINVKIAIKEDQIVIEFPVKLRWFSMGAAEARGMIQVLEANIKTLEEQK